MVRISSFHPPRRCCGGGGGGNQNTFYCVGARLTAHQRLSNSRLLLPKSPHSAASATAKLCLKLCFRCASALLHRPTDRTDDNCDACERKWEIIDGVTERDGEIILWPRKLLSSSKIQNYNTTDGIRSRCASTCVFDGLPTPDISLHRNLFSDRRVPLLFIQRNSNSKRNEKMRRISGCRVLIKKGAQLSSSIDSLRYSCCHHSNAS